MRKIFLCIMIACLTFISYSQQPFIVKITRPGTFFGAGSNITLFYLGEEKAKIKNKSEYTLTGTLPADSIIELKFKVPLQMSTKFFLYPNDNFNYLLSAKVNMKGINIKDITAYSEGSSAGVGEKQRILPGGVSVNKRNLGISYVNEKTLSSDEIRKQWVRQGGRITGRSISYIGTFARSAFKDPPTETIIVGGGWNYTRNSYKLKIPEYKKGLAPWTSFVYGLGLSLNLHGSFTSIDMPAPTEDMEVTGSSFVMMITGNAGFTLGLGKFRTETNYKGVTIDLTYKPAIVSSMSEGFSSSQINWKGFGFDISGSSFSAFANSIAPKAKSKFSFLFLPPLGNTPLMISFGYGRVWYR